MKAAVPTSHHSLIQKMSVVLCEGCKAAETAFFGFISTYINPCAGCRCKGEVWMDGIDVFCGILPACPSETLGSNSVLPVITQ